MRFWYNEHVIYTLCFEIPIIIFFLSKSENIIFFYLLTLSNIAVIKIKYI